MKTTSFLFNSVDEVVSAVLAAPVGLRTEIRIGVSQSIVDKHLPGCAKYDPDFRQKLTTELYDRALRREKELS